MKISSHQIKSHVTHVKSHQSQPSALKAAGSIIQTIEVFNELLNVAPLVPQSGLCNVVVPDGQQALRRLRNNNNNKNNWAGPSAVSETISSACLLDHGHQLIMQKHKLMDMCQDWSFNLYTLHPREKIIIISLFLCLCGPHCLNSWVKLEIYPKNNKTSAYIFLNNNFKNVTTSFHKF